MFTIIALGSLLRAMKIGRHGPDALRQGITDIVFYLLLPALVLKAIWLADLGWRSVAISATATFSILATLAVAIWVCRACQLPRAASGALILAAIFPNATYLGLPVLVSTFGERGASIAIQYDLFACLPLVLTLGVWLAHRFGEGKQGNILLGLVKVPPLWAAFIAVMLNLSAIKPSPWLLELLSMLGGSVVPLMLLSLGISLRWPEGGLKRLRVVTGPVLLQLIFMPFIALMLTGLFGLEGWVRQAVILEAAMPSMVLGIMLCDRYGLESSLYALAVTVTTLLSLATLPMWYALVS